MEAAANAPTPEPVTSDSAGDDRHEDSATFQQTGDPLLLIGRDSGQRSRDDTAEASYLSPFQ